VVTLGPSTTLSVLVMSIQTLSLCRHERAVIGLFFQDAIRNRPMTDPAAARNVGSKNQSLPGK
jgi:hypothetical protein